MCVCDWEKLDLGGCVDVIVDGCGKDVRVYPGFSFVKGGFLFLFALVQR